jgi:hypothetical protein
MPKQHLHGRRHPYAYFSSPMDSRFEDGGNGGGTADLFKRGDLTKRQTVTLPCGTSDGTARTPSVEERLGYGTYVVACWGLESPTVHHASGGI